MQPLRQMFSPHLTIEHPTHVMLYFRLIIKLVYFSPRPCDCSSNPNHCIPNRRGGWPLSTKPKSRSSDSNRPTACTAWMQCNICILHNAVAAEGGTEALPPRLFFIIQQHGTLLPLQFDYVPLTLANQGQQQHTSARAQRAGAMKSNPLYPGFRVCQCVCVCGTQSKQESVFGLTNEKGRERERGER